MPVVNEKDFSCQTCKHYKDHVGIVEGECRELEPREASMWEYSFSTPIPIATEAETWCGRWERYK